MTLADRIWWTKKSRIQTEKRLLQKDIYSQIILLWYTVFSVFASIYELATPSNNNLFSVLMISLSVMIMAVTLFIGSRGFKERAMLVKQCYEQLSVLNNKANAINSNNNSYNVIDLEAEYKNILSVCENHSDIDFKKAVVFEYFNTPKEHVDRLTKKPDCYYYFCVFGHMILNLIVSTLFVVIPILTWYLLR